MELVVLIGDGQTRAGTSGERAGGDCHGRFPNCQRRFGKWRESTVAVALQNRHVITGLVDDGEIGLAVTIEIDGSNCDWPGFASGQSKG